MSAPRIDRVSKLELDIDTRLVSLWAETVNVETWDIEAVATYMRAAYGMGYTQALAERERGLLCRTHGYKVPPRQRP